GPNWGHFESPETEALIEQNFNQFEEEKRLALLTELHELEGRLAVMIFVVHDLNPRAMSPKVGGFAQAQSWFQDLTPVAVSPRRAPAGGLVSGVRQSSMSRRTGNAHMSKYRTHLGVALAASLGIGLGATAAQAEGTLTVGMTAGDLPI